MAGQHDGSISWTRCAADISTARQSSAQRVDVNQPDSKGDAPLIIAAYEGCDRPLEMCEKQHHSEAQRETCPAVLLC